MKANSSLRVLPSGLLLSEESWLDEMERRGVPRRVAIADSIKATLASGTAVSGDAVAVHSVGGKNHQVVMIAGPSGHINDTQPTYYFYTGLAAGAQNQRLIDLFNASGSGKVVKVKKLFMQCNQAAITGVGLQYDVIRTSAVGTSGSTITGRTPVTGNPAIPAQITARRGATGGATESHILFPLGVDPEETRPGAGIMGMINWMPEGANIQELELPVGEGILVKQITSNTAGIMGCVLVVTISDP